MYLNFCGDKRDHVLANTTYTGLYSGKLSAIGFIFLQLDLITTSQAHEMYHTQMLELWGSRECHILLKTKREHGEKENLVLWKGSGDKNARTKLQLCPEQQWLLSGSIRKDFHAPHKNY